MAQIAEQNNVKQASDFLDLIQKYKGTTTTTSTNISAEGVNAMIADILGGTQGLAAVASGQKAAGGYNSSTNQLLINDLIARTTAQVAKASAGTTTKTSGAGSSNSTKALALITAAAKLFGGGNKSDTPKQQTYQSFNTSRAEEAQANKTSDPIASLNEQKGWTTTPTADNNVNTTNTEEDKTGSSALMDYGAGLDISGSGSGLGSGGDGVDSAGNALDLGSFEDIASVDALNGADLTAPENTSGDGGDGGVDLGNGSGDFGDGGGGEDWVICTELHAQGILPTNLYLASALRAAELSQEVMNGYHFWAVPLTKLMRRSKFLTRILAPVALARCNYLIGRSSFIGWLTVAAGEPICSALGHLIGHSTDWKVLYNGKH